MEINHAEHEYPAPKEVFGGLMLMNISDFDMSSQFAHFKFGRIEHVTPPACDGLQSGILGHHTLATVNPYLFPFAIEFALTGAIISYAMFNKIGSM